MNFTSFTIEPHHLLEGYIEKYANSNSSYSKTEIKDEDYLLIEPSSSKEGFFISTINTTKYTDISNNIDKYNILNSNVKNYDLIDNSGNLLYINNNNFKETIPKLKDAVLEDSISMMNYNNTIYAVSGIGIAFLLIGIVISLK